ncbi:hypothetical protein, partial [Herbaspirillum sp. BH-1]|uniref:hypothetical protein n=1 Tax=Herbaspirillum sp. (strain BH-1) TaxID=2058884 RepID=UPI001E2D9661
MYQTSVGATGGDYGTVTTGTTTTTTTIQPGCSAGPSSPCWHGRGGIDGCSYKSVGAATSAPAAAGTDRASVLA